MVKKTAADIKAIDKIRQLNKKIIDKEQKKEEEEAKCQKDKDEACKKAEEELAKEKEKENVAKNLHNIMNGINEGDGIMKIDGGDGKDVEEQSPPKKHGGLNKSTTKRPSSKTHKILSPLDQTQADEAPTILKAMQFMDTYVHPHRRVVLELAINLTKEDTFDEFTKVLVSFSAMPK
jgi:hypothetical protein